MIPVELVSKDKLLQDLIVTPYGMSLPDKTLTKIMGKQYAGQFFVSRDKFMSSWRERKFSNPNFQMKELNELLKEAGAEEIKYLKFERYHLQEVVG